MRFSRCYLTQKDPRTALDRFKWQHLEALGTPYSHDGVKQCGCTLRRQPHALAGIGIDDLEDAICKFVDYVERLRRVMMPVMPRSAAISRGVGEAHIGAFERRQVLEQFGLEHAGYLVCPRQRQAAVDDDRDLRVEFVSQPVHGGDKTIHWNASVLLSVAE